MHDKFVWHSKILTNQLWFISLFVDINLDESAKPCTLEIVKKYFKSRNYEAFSSENLEEMILVTTIT